MKYEIQAEIKCKGEGLIDIRQILVINQENQLGQILCHHYITSEDILHKNAIGYHQETLQNSAMVNSQDRLHLSPALSFNCFYFLLLLKA